MSDKKHGDEHEAPHKKAPRAEGSHGGGLGDMLVKETIAAGTIAWKVATYVPMKMFTLARVFLKWITGGLIG